MANWRYISGTFFTETFAATSYSSTSFAKVSCGFCGQLGQRGGRLADERPAVLVLHEQRLLVRQRQLLHAVVAVVELARRNPWRCPTGRRLFHRQAADGRKLMPSVCTITPQGFVLSSAFGAFALREQRQAAFDHLAQLRLAGQRAEERDVADELFVGRDGNDGDRLQFARRLGGCVQSSSSARRSCGRQRRAAIDAQAPQRERRSSTAGHDDEECSRDILR